MNANPFHIHRPARSTSHPTEHPRGVKLLHRCSCGAVRIVYFFGGEKIGERDWEQPNPELDLRDFEGQQTVGDVLDFVYGENRGQELGDYSVADWYLTTVGWLAPASQRTDALESWRTEKGWVAYRALRSEGGES